MGQLGNKLRSTMTNLGRGVSFWCPGCEEFHAISVEGQAPWKFDNNLTAPTFSPSVLVTSGHYIQGWEGPTCWCTYNATRKTPTSVICSRCHSFVRAGMIQFLTDSTHRLAGQTVPLPDLPEEYRTELVPVGK